MTVRRRPLASPSKEMLPRYDVIIVGSGYGGSVAAARLAAYQRPGGPFSVCVLERGREWIAGDFPHTLRGIIRCARSQRNPLGLFDVHSHKELDIVVGSGLGGTSLINAGSMVRPDAARLFRWGSPKGAPDLTSCFDRVARALHVAVNPRPPQKTAALAQAVLRCPDIGTFAYPPLAVTFQDCHRPPEDIHQAACNDCGNCLIGCNEAAKNTLDMNYLALAERKGACLFTRIEALTIEDTGDGAFRVHFKDHSENRFGRVTAEKVILAAGTLGSFTILASSRLSHGLALSDALGSCFSANGDTMGLCYNTNFMSDPAVGPTCSSSIARRDASDPSGDYTIMEGGAPPASLFLLRSLTALAGPFGRRFSYGAASFLKKSGRALADLCFMPFFGALTRSLVVMANAAEDGSGTLSLKDGKPVVSWPSFRADGFWEKAEAPMRDISRELQGVFLTIPKWTNPGTVHPLGGCVMAEDARHGVVNFMGEVFGYEGRLYVMDGSVIPGSIGVGPAFSIAALTEWFCDALIEKDRAQD